jgi:transposase-like protein
VAQASERNVLNLPVRVMFQDEARFGRLSDPRRCWAPAPLRPVVPVALVREYTYAYATVSPGDGSLDWMLTPKMDTLNMSAFLDHVSQRHADDYIVMVVDGASSHTSHDLRIPENMALVKLPPYSPELNPAERLWEEIREKEFANRVFDSLGSAIAQAARGLKRLESMPEGLQSLTGWPWILGSS